MKNTRILIAIILAAFSLSIWAHGGEDHGDAAVSVPNAATAPRASAQTEEFELVIVLNDKKMTLTLDRFATNAPVADAKIEVEIGNGLNVMASQTAPGLYTLAVPDKAFAKPGKYPLTISVQAGDASDLLSTTLDLTQPTSIAAPLKTDHNWLVRSILGALLLITVATLLTVAIRRRNRKL